MSTYPPMQQGPPYPPMQQGGGGMPQGQGPPYPPMQQGGGGMPQGQGPPYPPMQQGGGGMPQGQGPPYPGNVSFSPIPGKIKERYQGEILSPLVTSSLSYQQYTDLEDAYPPFQGCSCKR